MPQVTEENHTLDGIQRKRDDHGAWGLLLALYPQGVYNALHNCTPDDMRAVTQRFVDHVVRQLTA